MRRTWAAAVVPVLLVGGCGAGAETGSLERVEPSPARRWAAVAVACPALTKFGPGAGKGEIDRPGGLLSVPCSYGTTLLATTQIERDPARGERFARIFYAERSAAEAAGADRVSLPGYERAAVVNYAAGVGLVSVTTRSANAYLTFVLDDPALTSEAAIGARAGDLAAVLDEMIANLRE
ncbi:hypothetical protein ACQPZJ_43675 [Actinoplanes sp. CA-054009]